MPRAAPAFCGVFLLIRYCLDIKPCFLSQGYCGIKVWSALKLFPEASIILGKLWENAIFPVLSRENPCDIEPPLGRTRVFQSFPRALQAVSCCSDIGMS